MQKEFGISAHEALFVRPAWELDNLIREHVRVQQQQGGDY